MNTDLDFVNEFLVESYENLGRLDREFVILEENPTDKETLSSVFRTIHTIKGTCGFLGFDKLEKLTHVGENLLSKLRDGQLLLTPEITTGLLAMVDAIRAILANIEESKSEGDGDYSGMISQLTALTQQETPAAPPVLTQQETPAAPPALTQQETPTAPPALVDAGLPVQKIVEPRKTLGEILVETGAITPEAAELAVARQVAGDPRHIGEILVEEGQLHSQDVVQALKVQGESRSSALADSTIRVDVALLDRLMNLVGELVLTRNQIVQFTSKQKDASLTTTSQRLNLITTELQEGVMKTRMQPIGNIWGKFPRVVRDLALACGKQIQLEMEGQGTELDKTIIEAIKDPLTHLVRNSCDHGIETPAVRVAAGKPAEGYMKLRAFHEGGQVNIEISDDGGGIHPDKIKNKAIERRLISAEQAARMNEREALQLLFLPGFSTAEKITNVSGRGVGMDVVKTNIEKIGGIIDLRSEAGKGTTVRMKIPLTLAIIPALIVTSGEDRFAIPQVNLLEMVRLDNDQDRAGDQGPAGKSVEMVHGAPVFRLRGNLLPLVELGRELGKWKESKLGSQGTDGPLQATNIVVLQSGDRAFGLVVEGIHDTQEIVVKPLSKELKSIAAFSGATILGDGAVALILDVVGLAQRANLATSSTIDGRERGRSESAASAAGQHDTDKTEMQTLLLFQVGDQGRMAIPLAEVGRLEELQTKLIERSGSEEVIQYRGQIMPLIRLTERLTGGDSGSAGESRDSMQVVVYSDHGRNVGLVVENILDIVEEKVTIRRDASRHAAHGSCVLGSAVIQQRVTDLLDVRALVGGAIHE